MKINIRAKRRTARTDRGRILFAFVSSCVGGTNPNTPNWSSMAEDAITWGGVGVLGTLVFICGSSGTVQDLETLDCEFESR